MKLAQRQNDMRARMSSKYRKPPIRTPRVPVEVTGMEVLQKLVDGVSFKNIAWEVGGSVRTMHLRVQDVMRKYGAKSIYQLIALLSADGILKRPEVKK